MHSAVAACILDGMSVDEAAAAIGCNKALARRRVQQLKRAFGVRGRRLSLLRQCLEVA
jgi:hypothetical protein